MHLLRLVEAVHFINEQHRASTFGKPLRCLGQHLPHIGQA